MSGFFHSLIRSDFVHLRSGDISDSESSELDNFFDMVACASPSTAVSSDSGDDDGNESGQVVAHNQMNNTNDIENSEYQPIFFFRNARQMSM